MNANVADLDITVQGSNIHLGDFLPARVRSEITKLTAKYFGRPTRSLVYFSREGRSYRCTVNVEIGALRMVTGEARAKTCAPAFVAALRKTAKQLRRMKRAVRDDKPRPFVTESVFLGA